jgi:hypothetical protein
LLGSHNVVITDQIQQSNHRNHRRVSCPPRLHHMTSSLHQVHLTLDT